VQGFAREAVAVAGIAARLPRRVDDVVTRMEEGRLSVESPRVEQRMRALERVARRVVSAVLFAGLFIGGLLARPDEPVFGWVLIGVSAVPLLHAVFAGLGRR
jgi:hypothetical protein